MKATLSSAVATQKDGAIVPGSYTISLSASFFVAYSVWHEKGSVTPIEGPTLYFDQTYSDFYFTVTNVDISFDIQVSSTGDTWTAKVVNPTQSNISTTNHVPERSNLNNPSIILKCINDQVNQHIATAIQGVNYASAMADAVNSMLKTIPNSGHLTDKIIYQFPPSHLAFGNDGSIRAGISGEVLYNGTPYAGAHVIVPLPPAIEHDVHIYVNNYEFNALLWAFQENGSLSTTILSSQAPDVLNTSILGQFIAPLREKFGDNAPVNVQVDSMRAPTVYNETVVVLTEEAANGLKLPANILALLTEKNLVGAPYQDTKSFSAAAADALDNDFNTYNQILIDALQGEIALFTDTLFLLSIMVMYQGVSTFAFSFQLEKQDLLGSFALNVKDSTQILTFGFSEVSKSAELVKTDIGEIDPQAFLSLWIIIDAYVNNKSESVGNTGVALPSLEGFLFDNATITFLDQNVSVDTDVFYGSIAQLLRVRRMRKRHSERAKRAEERAKEVSVNND